MNPRRAGWGLLTLAPVALLLPDALGSSASNGASARAAGLPRQEIRPTAVDDRRVTFVPAGLASGSIRSAKLCSAVGSRVVPPRAIRKGIRSGRLTLRRPRGAPEESLRLVVSGDLAVPCAIYHVSPDGSDSAPGDSPERAWRTIARVNRAELHPGDHVLFQGGATFADEVLRPVRSGRRTSRILYGSYGPGLANLPRGIFLESVRGLIFQDLAISGPEQGVLASSDGAVRDLTLKRLAIDGVTIAINSASRRNRNWTIRDSRITRTGDSGLIVKGDDFLIKGNTIEDTGTDPAITHPKHGIYLNVTRARVLANTIRRSQANGVSVRYRNSRVEDNRISDLPVGIAFFQYDRRAGRSLWRDNRISGTTSAGIYVSARDRAGRTRESFVITGNRISKRSGVHLNLRRTSGKYTVARNHLE